MNSKERMLIALNKGKPDRLPATLHQWQPYHLKYYMDGMDALEAFKTCGLDAAVSYFKDMGQTQFMNSTESQKLSEDWIDEVEVLDDAPNHILTKHTVHTPEGKLSYQVESNEKTSWVKEHLIKEKEDIKLLKYLPIPKVNKKDVEKKFREENKV